MKSRSNRLVELQLFYLRLPFRSKFSHATAARECNETVVAAALLADGTVGFGEGVPRKYVTGETIESVLTSITECLAGSLDNLAPGSFPELLEFVDQLPFRNDLGQIINSARCCVELALLDAYSRYFQCPLTGIVGWLGDAALAEKNPQPLPRVSGVLDVSDADRLKRRLRLMRWYGLRDFKLKVGSAHDLENIALVRKIMGSGLDRGRLTLRVDANGAWDVDTAVAMSTELDRLGVCCLEQPLAASDRDHWRVLASLAPLPLMADESLITLDDGRFLAENDLVDYFNIRISKNGGLIPALRLAALASQSSRQYQLGAMVGETGILAAAGRLFLQMVPDTSFTEICYSTFLLREDITSCNLRFGYAGRIPKARHPGLGISIRRDRLEKFLVAFPRKIALA